MPPAVFERRSGGAAMVALLLLAGCSGSNDGATTRDGEDPVTTTATTQPATTSVTALPESSETSPPTTAMEIMGVPTTLASAGSSLEAQYAGETCFDSVSSLAFTMSLILEGGELMLNNAQSSLDKATIDCDEASYQAERLGVPDDYARALAILKLQMSGPALHIRFARDFGVDLWEEDTVERFWSAVDNFEDALFAARF